jgi:hypothetical protein
MKNKSTLLIIIVVLIIANCSSQNAELQGKWSLIDFDKDGQASEFTNSLLRLYGIDTNDPEIKELYGEIMEQAIVLIKTMGLKLIFDGDQLKAEFMGQRTVSSYKINNNIITVKQNGINSESNFRIDGDKLFYSGLIWEKEK